MAFLPGRAPRGPARVPVACRARDRPVRSVMTYRRGRVRHCYDGTRAKDVSMSEGDWLAGQFEQNRPRLRAVAYRMLGSAAEADDAVQEAWLRLGRSGADGVQNLAGWLTTAVTRVCLDMLRARKSRREQDLDVKVVEAFAASKVEADPEQEAVMADSVGLALLVVLETLAPA